MLIKEMWDQMCEGHENAPPEYIARLEHAFILGVSATNDYVAADANPHNINLRSLECREYVNGRMTALGFTVEKAN